MKRLLSLTLLAIIGCSPAVPAEPSALEEAAKKSGDVERFDGRVVAANATDIQAPPTSYSLNGHFFNHSWSNIDFLGKDGDRVKAGDMVAKFKFYGKDQLPHIQSRIKRSRAESERIAVGLDDTLGRLLTQQKKAVLRTEAARLDTLKEGAISARQLRVYELVHTMAKFENDAIEARIAAHRDAMEAQEARDRLRIAHADAQLALFDVYKKRFDIRAPHDGVVRHQRHPWRRRKVRKGDGVPSGSPVISLSEDTVLAIEAFIPEALAASVKVGDALEVYSVADERRWTVHLTEIKPFPQRLGFLHKDDDHPRALERAYVGLAPVPAEIEGLSAGNEVQINVVSGSTP